MYSIHFLRKSWQMLLIFVCVFFLSAVFCLSQLALLQLYICGLRTSQVVSTQLFFFFSCLPQHRVCLENRKIYYYDHIKKNVLFKIRTDKFSDQTLIFSEYRCDMLLSDEAAKNDPPTTCEEKFKTYCTGTPVEVYSSSCE